MGPAARLCMPGVMTNALELLSPTFQTEVPGPEPGARAELAGGREQRSASGGRGASGLSP